MEQVYDVAVIGPCGVGCGPCGACGGILMTFDIDYSFLSSVLERQAY